MKRSLLLFLTLCTWQVFAIRVFESIAVSSSSLSLDESAVREINSLSKFHCDFGSDNNINLCSWTSSDSFIRWRPGQGAHSHWSGGPPVDHTFGNSSGGFGYFETSYRAPSSARAFNFNPFNSIKSVIDLTRNITKKAEPIVESRIQPLLYKINNLKEKLENRLQGTRIINNVQNIYQNLRETPSKAGLVSPVMPATRPQGVCVQFYYSVAGLSADRISLTIEEKSSLRSRVLWQTKFDSQDEWIKMETLYAHPSDHQLIIDGYAKNTSNVEREYRGYIAVDDITFAPKLNDNNACYGHCTFDGGFCDWYNLEYTDDTDWKLGKGSHSLDTGPSQDYNSFAKDLPPGNFIYLDSQLPLRFLDRAILVSPDFQATSTSKGYCMKFAYHMYGDGIGKLNVIMQTKQRGDELLWSLSGDQGNRWYMAQVPLYSRQPFKLLFEATVGATPRGNIALDAFSFSEEFCPTNPSSASSRIGDCSFEESLCNWVNSQIDDDFDWVRVQLFPSVGSFIRNVDSDSSTRLNSSNIFNSYYLTLNGDMLRPDKSGLSAHISSPFLPAHSLQCMTFHYLMYQDVSRDHLSPSLGGLRVHLTWTDRFNETHTQLIWRLNNHQSNKWRQARIPLSILSEFDRRSKAPEYQYRVVIKGVWSNLENGFIGIDEISFANGECDMVPSYARVEPAECTFDRETCGWSDFTINNSQNVNSAWAPFKLIAPPAVSGSDSGLFIKDHTFNNHVGYMATTAAGSSLIQKSIFISPILSSRSDAMSKNSTEKCIGFWFALFPGKDNLPSSKSLSLFQAVLLPRLGIVDAKSFLLWKITQKTVSDDRWNYGQVTFRNELKYRLLFKAESMDGGFALDDISFYDGPCQTRPFMAAVNDTLVQF